MKASTIGLDVRQMRNGKSITKRVNVSKSVYPVAKAFVHSGMMMRDFAEDSITLEDGCLVTVKQPEPEKLKKKKGDKDAE